MHTKCNIKTPRWNSTQFDDLRTTREMWSRRGRRYASYLDYEEACPDRLHHRETSRNLRANWLDYESRLESTIDAWMLVYWCLWDFRPLGTLGSCVSPYRCITKVGVGAQRLSPLYHTEPPAKSEARVSVLLMPFASLAMARLGSMALVRREPWCRHSGHSLSLSMATFSQNRDKHTYSGDIFAG